MISMRSWPKVAGIPRDWLHDCRWALAALWLLLVLIYSPGLGGGYVFDDFSNIIDNIPLHVTDSATWGDWLSAMFSSPSSEFQRPLAMLSFAINHVLTGLDPYWMKVTNLGIHLVNAWLVFGLVRCVLRVSDIHACTSDGIRRNWIALWVAATWALNPINLMAVLFVVQRMESLCHTFVFAGLWLYTAGRAQLLATGRGWMMALAGLLGGTALGVMVKESAALLPLYALVLELTLLGFATHRRARDARLLKVFAGVLVIPAVIGLGWLLPNVLGGAYAGRDFTLGERLLTESRVLVDYLHWTLLPDLGRLSLYHDDYSVSRGLVAPPSTLLSLLLLAGLFAVALWLRKRRPLMALGLLWFFAAHLLTATVVPLELMFEHRNYFASLGLFLALGDGLLSAPGQRWQRAGIAAAILLVALYAGLTSIRVREWRDPMQFSLIEASKHPESPRATYDLARNLVVLSYQQPGSAYVAQAFLALDQAMRVPRATALPEAAAITLAARTGRPIPAAWWKSLQRKLRMRPVGPQETGALATLVACQLQQPCPLPSQDMSASFAAALAHGPNAELLSIHGNYALNIQHDPTQALQLWRQAAQLAPQKIQYQETLARMLIATDQLDEADRQIARIRQIGRLGQNEQVADELQRLAVQARSERKTQAPIPE
jgi:hypothetical protein